MRAAVASPLPRFHTRRVSEEASETAVVARRAGLLALGTLGSRILGALRDAVIAATFAVAATDAFWLAFTLPNALRVLLGEGAVSAMVVPVFTETREREGAESARTLFARLSGTMLVVLAAVSMLGVVAAPLLVRLYAAGFDAETTAQAVTLTRWVFPYIALMGAAALATGALHASGRFTAPACAPLLLNGVFLLGISQGERLIVANRFGLEELAWFSVGFMLTMMPVNLLSKSLQSLFLPILSRHQDNDDAFSYTAVTACQATVVPGLALALGFALFGPTVIGLLYGEKYLPAVGIVVLLAVMQGIRLAQAGAVVSALARAQSRIPLYITITRFAFIPLAFLAVLYLQVGILSLVIIGIAGEIAALVLAYSMLWARLRVRISQLGPGLLLAGTVLAVIIWQVVTIKMETGLWGGIHSGQIVPIGLLLLSPLVCRNLWAEGLGLLRRRRD